MKSNAAILVMMVFATVPALIGCDSSQSQSSVVVDEMVKTLAEVDSKSAADVWRVVSNAEASERAVMFIELRWSFLGPQRTRFAEFVVEFLKRHPKAGVGFHYVDCTPVTSGYAPLRALDGWSELEKSAGTSLIHGWGEVAWLERGRVLHVQQILDVGSASQLVEKTEDLMPGVLGK